MDNNNTDQLVELSAQSNDHISMEVETTGQYQNVGNVDQVAEYTSGIKEIKDVVDLTDEQDGECSEACHEEHAIDPAGDITYLSVDAADDSITMTGNATEPLVDNMDLASNAVDPPVDNMDLTGYALDLPGDDVDVSDDATDLTGDAVELTASGPETPASQSDTSVSMSSEKSTPSRRMTEFDNISTSSGSVKNMSFPTRIGITFRKGERIEAMDFMKKWFPAKIIEINEEDQQVLIHFDGWNRRYDEWLDMSSERIGPLVRHSERKDRYRRHRAEHKVGEQVMAKWTDCKMYPAKITALLHNGSYEVTFYDGFKKQVQPINIRTMPPEFKQNLPIQPVDEAVLKKSKLKLDIAVPSGPAEKLQRRASDENTGKTKDTARRRSSEKDTGSSGFHSRTIVVGGPPTSAEKVIKSQPVCVPVKSEPIATQTEYEKPKMEITKLVPMCVKMEVQPGNTVYTTAQDINRPAAPCTVLSSFPPLLPAKAFVVEQDHNRYKCTYSDCNKGFRKKQLLDSHVKHYHIEGGGMPRPAAPQKRRRKTTSTCSTEMDKPHSKRAKKRRKLRHVSAESTFITPIIKREISDTELPIHQLTPLIHAAPAVPRAEEISTQTVFSPPEGSVVSAVPAIIKVEPDMVREEMTYEPRPERTASQDTLGTEESSITDGEAEADDYLKPDELVNCICDFYEENGLMIQCEVCMCWQHAACFGITDRTLPKTYVCFICENPPGVRESQHYIHEQEWFKSGELSGFNYLPSTEDGDERTAAIKATNTAVADIHQLNTVLHSLRQQLKILRTRDESKLKMWRLDWDSVETFDDPIESSVQMEDSGSHLGTAAHLDTPPDMDCATETCHSNSYVSGEHGEQSNQRLTVAGDKSDLSQFAECSSAEASGETAIPGNNKTVRDERTCQERECKNTDTGNVRLGEPGYQAEVVEVPTVAGEVLIDTQETELRTETVERDESGVDDLVPPVLPLQTHVHFTLDEDATNSDSTESAVEDPTETYEKNLLQHITRIQTEIDRRLQLVEEQVILLEELECRVQGDSLQPHAVLTDVPKLRSTIRTLDTDLGKIKSMSIFH